MAAICAAVSRSHLSQIPQIADGNVSQAESLVKRKGTDFYKLPSAHQLISEEFKKR